MTDRELMQQALSALNQASPSGWSMDSTKRHYGTIDALRARLAQPEQEPVAWVAYENGEKHGIDFDEDEIAKLPVGTMLYTAPPQREWVGLTDEEQNQVAWSCGSMSADWLDFARAIEAKLKEKNT